MSLKKITETDHLILDLVYGTERNFTGKQIYQNPQCYLHPDAVVCLEKALQRAKSMGYGFKIFDAFRPMEAQNLLWAIVPDPNYVANPHVGSNHSRGIAVDLTLVDEQGRELNMGTPFDDFSQDSWHACTNLSADVLKNRALLLGIMTASGWDKFDTEWWHYQLHDIHKYPLLNDSVLTHGLMDAVPHLI